MPSFPHRALFLVAVLLAALPAGSALSFEEPAQQCGGLPGGPDPAWSLERHPEVAAMATTIAGILRGAQVSYQGPRGLVEGFVAGPTYRYPDGRVPFYIYARDTATILPQARFYAGESALRSTTEEFLRLQYADATTSSDGDLGIPVGAQFTGPRWGEARVLQAVQALFEATPEIQKRWPAVSALPS